MYYKEMEDLLSLKTVLELRNLGLQTNSDVKGGKDMWTIKEIHQSKHCSFQDILVIYL